MLQTAVGAGASPAKRDRLARWRWMRPTFEEPGLRGGRAESRGLTAYAKRDVLQPGVPGRSAPRVIRLPRVHSQLRHRSVERHHRRWLRLPRGSAARLCPRLNCVSPRLARALVGTSTEEGSDVVPPEAGARSGLNELVSGSDRHSTSAAVPTAPPSERSGPRGVRCAVRGSGRHQCGSRAVLSAAAQVTGGGAARPSPARSPWQRPVRGRAAARLRVSQSIPA